MHGRVPFRALPFPGLCASFLAVVICCALARPLLVHGGTQNRPEKGAPISLQSDRLKRLHLTRYLLTTRDDTNDLESRGNPLVEKLDDATNIESDKQSTSSNPDAAGQSNLDSAGGKSGNESGEQGPQAIHSTDEKRFGNERSTNSDSSATRKSLDLKLDGLSHHDEGHTWAHDLDDAHEHLEDAEPIEESEGNDDKSVRADDASIKQLEAERIQLAKKLSEMETLRKRMAHKHELLNRVRTLQQKLDQGTDEAKRLREEGSRMEESVKSAILKRDANSDERDSIAKERHDVERLLEELRSEKETSEVEYEKVKKERAYIDGKEKELLLQKEKLEMSLKELVDQFQQDGFHTWLKSNLDTFPAVIRETILKTSNALDPVIQGVEGASELNERLTSETTEAITRYLPMIRDSPFYTGLIFYIILLFPTVSACWLVLKVRARLSMLTVEHYLITVNLYFGTMSTVCAIMTVLGGTDILVVFLHRSRRIAETFMLFHGLLFIIHLVLHGMTAYVSGSRKDFAQYICISCLGLHFFLHAYKRAILNLDPNVGAAAYVTYALVFWYMVYDRGVHIVHAIVSGRKSGLSAFGTFPAEDNVTNSPLPAPRERPRQDTTVYFAGLPVFNGPSKSALNDAKTI